MSIIRKVRHGCAIPENGTYIGRNPRWGDTFWGNPFKLRREEDREFILGQYELWLKTADHILARIDELRGRTLWCHCHPLQCHGEILAEVASMTHEQRDRWRVSPYGCFEFDFTSEI